MLGIILNYSTSRAPIEGAETCPLDDLLPGWHNIQLHHATGDTEVPQQFAQTLANDLHAANKPVELYTYAGADHNLAQGFTLAMTRSVTFFDKHLKG